MPVETKSKNKIFRVCDHKVGIVLIPHIYPNLSFVFQRSNGY